MSYVALGDGGILAKIMGTQHGLLQVKNGKVNVLADRLIGFLLRADKKSVWLGFVGKLGHDSNGQMQWVPIERLQALSLAIIPSGTKRPDLLIPSGWEETF